MSDKLMNTLEKENGEKLTVSYFLTDTASEDASTEYGIGIRIEETGEEEVVERISITKDCAEELLELCFKNGVTPTTLLDVVYDYLCS